MDDIRVVVSGTGRMGNEVLAAVCRTPGLVPVGVLEGLSHGGEVALPDGSGSVPLSSDPTKLFEAARPDVLIDFTFHEWTERVVPVAVTAGVRPVIGTTGLTEGFVCDLAAQCRLASIGGVIAPNFAIGAVLMMHFARIAAPYFDVAEIIELHHDKKVDAPSGTALTTAREMAAARGSSFEHPETEKTTIPGTRGGVDGGITIHSVRLPGLVAHQEVLFGGLGQTLTIRHDSTSRESFIPGVILAAREVMTRTELIVGLDRLMGLIT
ncbi:MAG: 4-hydroxy-tetrahydrodipicolinate reductase [Chloroflexi bacterium]|nr:4-hydroxy-tetrahydrodipicolinate reductase [Chloroflexota bacterium]